MRAKLPPDIERLLPLADGRIRIVTSDARELAAQGANITFGRQREEQVQMGPEEVGKAAQCSPGAQYLGLMVAQQVQRRGFVEPVIRTNEEEAAVGIEPGLNIQCFPRPIDEERATRSQSVALDRCRGEVHQLARRSEPRPQIAPKI